MEFANFEKLMVEFESLLKLIISDEIRKVTCLMLERAPDKFITMPSSITGKYHVTDERCVGGLILHTKRAVIVGDHLCRSYDIGGIHRDLILAALFIHDIARPVEDKNTKGTHPFIIYDVLALNNVSLSDHNEDLCLDIIKLAELHMGRWTKNGKWNSKNSSQEIVHLADFIASRENIIVSVIDD